MENQKDILKNSCDKVVDFSYMKKFTLQELEAFKNDLSSNMIEMDSIESEFQHVKDEFKTKLKPLKSEVKEYLTYIRDKARTVREECYVIFEGEYAVYFNEDGEEVYRRPLEASEKQKTIFMETRKAVNI